MPLRDHLSTRAFQEFFRTEALGGAVLVTSAVAALVIANSAWADGYHRIWATAIPIGAGRVLSLTAHQWINDGLMAIFFLLVGLEIKRELLVGELASPRQAALPIAAALGGMVVPALIYVAAQPAAAPAARGWGIPMATDIAFALGVLALLAPRAPSGLKVFLAALAIVDDLGAVLVIALFYTGDDLAWSALARWPASACSLLLALNAARCLAPAPYSLLGVGALVLRARVRRARDHRRRAAGADDSRPHAHQRAPSSRARRATLLDEFDRTETGDLLRADEQGPAGRDRRARARERRGRWRRCCDWSTRCTGSSRSASCRCSRSRTPASR